MPSPRIFVALPNLVLLVGFLGVGCTGLPSRVPLHDGLGSYARMVGTRSEEAQRYFDQGLVLTHAFNYEEAYRSFEEAARQDPRCAMAWWGMALVSGPHINNPGMQEEDSRRAYDASRKALELAASATPVERALIEALAKRYAWPAPEDRKPLDQAWAEAMREVHGRFPLDPEVVAARVESLLMLRPWDLWMPDGRPQPGTEEVIAILEDGLRRWPEHPYLNHAYVHAVEASSQPERAVAAADRLRTLVPGAAHLVHMPSHIDIRLGRYEAAALANERAIEADRRFFARGGRGHFYSLYRAHNAHFLAYASMFEGRREAALRAARLLVADMPEEDLRAMPDMLEGFLAMRYHVLVRFGGWDEILAEPAPPEGQPVTTAFWRYARGVALSVKGRLEEAQVEIAAFEAARAAVPATRQMGNNSAAQVLEIAAAVLRGEYLFRRGQTEAAFASLHEAVRLDRVLRYDEPWGWMQPPEHALGALLLEAGRVAEAEDVYRADLLRNPENGWSLHGLAECLRRSARAEEAESVEGRFRKAWARADTELEASCFCRKLAAKT